MPPDAAGNDWLAAPFVSNTFGVVLFRSRAARESTGSGCVLGDGVLLIGHPGVG
ncbi:MAG: hypothetical protein IAE87_09000 [Rhodobacteraceae bacterium]|nr:hypothetical protein [Paracoccaceae bacterium]